MLPCSQLDKSNEKKKLKTNYIDRSYIHLLECDLQVSLSLSPNIFVRKILTSFAVSFLLCTRGNCLQMGNKKTPNLPTIKDPQLQLNSTRDLDGLGEAIHLSTKGEEGSRNRTLFSEREGGRKFFGSGSAISLGETEWPSACARHSMRETWKCVRQTRLIDRLLVILFSGIRFSLRISPAIVNICNILITKNASECSLRKK